MLSAAGRRAALALFRGEGSEELFDDATRQLAELDDAVLGERLQLGWSLGQILLCPSATATLRRRSTARWPSRARPATARS
jgi:hypothetical protein